MPTHRISMRKFREVLRLAHQQQYSTREIAAAVRLSHTTVHNYLQRAAEAALTWPLPENLAHSALEARLFPKETANSDSVRRPVSDWPSIEELNPRQSGQSPYIRHHHSARSCYA